MSRCPRCNRLKGKGWWISCTCGEYQPTAEEQIEQARKEIISGFLKLVEKAMREQNISRSELARRMGCKPSNVTQMLNSDRNLTIGTMVTIAFHLNAKFVLFNNGKKAEAEKLTEEVVPLEV
jgi:antitoxin component HigA of HigAB toxin-antitoxin module